MWNALDAIRKGILLMTAPSQIDAQKIFVKSPR